MADLLGGFRPLVREMVDADAACDEWEARDWENAPEEVIQRAVVANRNVILWVKDNAEEILDV